MNILFDIGHPAHVHLIKYASQELKSHGHSVFFSVRDIPVAKRLMDVYGMEYVDLGKKRKSLSGKAITVIGQDMQLLRFVKLHKIDYGISSGIVLPHISIFTSMKAIKLDDDDDIVEPLIVKYAHPFSAAVLTPSCIKRKTPHAVYYEGTHELAYLHPKRFTPNPVVLERAGLTEGEPFFVMRFVAFKGHHDVGQGGLTMEQKQQLIDLLKPHGRIIITSERALEPEFEPYRLPVPPEDIHSLMAFATMFVGDSQTMTSEAAILGVPAFKCNTFSGRLSVPNELENKYHLCESFLPQEFDSMLRRIKECLDTPDIKAEWQRRRARLLDDKIDVTAFFVWFVENYPESQRIMQENPDYQLRFR